MNSFTPSPAAPSPRSTEEAGLFKTALAHVAVQIVLDISQSNRGDIVLRGFVENDTPIEVLFAGRRTSIAAPLINVLKQRWAHSNKSAKPGLARPTTDQVRQPVHILGSWRPRFEKDNQGWVTRSYQLVVAQWSITDATGQEKTYGALPDQTLRQQA